MVFLIGCKYSSEMVMCPLWCGEGTVFDFETKSCVLDHSVMQDMECDPRNDRCVNDMFCSPTYFKCMKNMNLGQKCPDFVGNDIITCNARQNLYCIEGYCLPVSNDMNKCANVRCQQGYQCDPLSGSCSMIPCHNVMSCQQGEFCNRHTKMCERYRNEGESCLQYEDYCKTGLTCNSNNICVRG